MDYRLGGSEGLGVMFRRIGLVGVFIFILVFDGFALAPPDPRVYDVYGDREREGSLSASGLLPVPDLPSYVSSYSESLLGLATINPLFIMIEFQDVKHASAHDFSYFEDLIFGSSGSSMDSYFNENSGGRLRLEKKTNYTAWFTSAYDMRYYGADSGSAIDYDYSRKGYIYNLALEAVTFLDGAGFDFSPFDVNGDNVIDAVIIIHAGNAQEISGSSNDIWSHQWQINAEDSNPGVSVSGGFRVVDYMMVAEYSKLGVFAHEFGHILGLPDLYNSITGKTVCGDWCLMDVGAHLGDGDKPAHISGWCKSYLGWGTSEEITEVSSGLDIYSTSEMDDSSLTKEFLKLPILGSDEEYFLVEYRRTSGGTNYFDQDLLNQGVLIWHIDQGVIDANLEYNRVNVDSRGIDVVEAGDTFIDVNGSQATDVYSSVLDIFSSPKSDAYSGAVSNITVSNFSGAGLDYMDIDVYMLRSEDDKEVLSLINYPNPTYDGKSKIRIDVSGFLVDASLRIYDLSGRLIYDTGLDDSSFLKDSSSDYNWVYELEWGGIDNNNERVATGVYLYVVKDTAIRAAGKIAVIR